MIASIAYKQQRQLLERIENMPPSFTLKVQSIVKNESSPINVPTYTIDAASLAGWLTAFGTFKTATDAIISGVLSKETVRIYETELSSALPVSQWARRELKMLVTYVGDTSGDTFRIEVPTPDLDALTLETGDANYVNILDAGVMASWVTAFEAIARSPNDETETVTVETARIVGRNI